jgi:hypothetical protein
VVRVAKDRADVESFSWRSDIPDKGYLNLKVEQAVVVRAIVTTPSNG